MHDLDWPFDIYVSDRRAVHFQLPQSTLSLPPMPRVANKFRNIWRDIDGGEKGRPSGDERGGAFFHFFVAISGAFHKYVKYRAPRRETTTHSEKEGGNDFREGQIQLYSATEIFPKGGGGIIRSMSSRLGGQSLYILWKWNKLMLFVVGVFRILALLCSELGNTPSCTFEKICKISN